MSTILTQSNARALLTNRTEGDKLLEIVLLDIFDAYRQDIELQPSYKNVWNSRDGWFKLAHVCRSWRRVVLSSPSRLHLHLLFTPRRSSRARVLNRLPLLPILIDYSAETVTWTKREESLVLAAIKHRSRVHGIALRRQYPEMAKFLRALSHPFPALESLEISLTRDERELIFPAAFLSGSASSLRRLSLRPILQKRLSPLLSSATGLVELTLTLRVESTALPEAWFIANLRLMSHLRRLELNLDYHDTIYPESPELPASAGDVFQLSELTHLLFRGHRLYLEALVIQFVAPLLQHLNVALCGQSIGSFPIPYLCNFICNAECQFTKVSLGFGCRDLRFCASTSFQSPVDVQPFTMVIPEPISLKQLAQELSRPLETVEGVVIAWDGEPWHPNGRIHRNQLRGFFKHVPQVKWVQAPAALALAVAGSFQQGGQEPVLDLLPILKLVEVFLAMDHHGTLLANRYRGDKLPENVLLEIFDAYRHDIEIQPNYKKVWNSGDGWFKLAHVCRSWRRVVLLSPSRLHLHLLFTPRRSSKATVLSRLPSLPILIDYSTGTWARTEREENLTFAAIKHRSRVHGITLRKRYTGEMFKLLKALGSPFPSLESLDIGPTHDCHTLILPAAFLSGSAPSLRRLSLQVIIPRRLSPLLSSATGLVELTLTLRVTKFTALPDAWFIANLQSMSHLRRLELNLDYRDTRSTHSPQPSDSAGDVVQLSELTHIFFRGHQVYLQALVIRLAAPLLQHLNAALCGQSLRSFPISHLCKFICDAECQFTDVSLGLGQKLKFCAGTSSQSPVGVDVQPFTIIIPEPVSLKQLGRELSGPLTTVKELTIAWDCEPWRRNGRIQRYQWGEFCKHVPQVKKVQVPAQVARDVAHSFQQGDQEPVLDLLPALELVEVFSAVGVDGLYKPICDAFSPLLDSRRLAGRPIRLVWTY
ncbi:hypothetical protein H4582DRAFT_2093831 [Lactarius indigo]|nr:hypothetical protein H4582DRAFT_2093831 [Lactarius indigo]